MFSFVHLWMFAFLPAPWLVWYLMPARQVNRIAVRVPFGDRISASFSGGSVARKAAQTSVTWLVPALIWILVVTAMARPQWLEPPITRDIPTRDLLLLVDLSGSMKAEDFTSSDGEKVDRLTAVKQVLGDFLVRRQGDRVGLVVFGDAPYLQAPFSTDLDLVRQLLDGTEIGMAGPRTAIGDAIGLGVNLFDSSTAPAKTIIALTDGNDTKSQVPPVEAARVANQKDIRIHTVAIGDPATLGEEKLDEATLQSVAETTGGQYFFAGDRQQLEGIYEQLDQIETREVSVVSHQPRRDLYYWPLLIGLFISIARRGLAAAHQSRDSTKIQTPSTVLVDPVTGELRVVA